LAVDSHLTKLILALQFSLTFAYRWFQFIGKYAR